MSDVGGVVNIASALSEMATSRPYSIAVACPAGRDREGRAQRYPLGSYGAVGLSEARKAARALRERVCHCWSLG